MFQSLFNRLVIVLIFLLSLAGCSSTKLAYRYADWGIVWWVEDYIPMTDEQEAQLEKDIVELRQWHCSSELPRYSSWLSELKQDVRSGELQRDTVAHHQEQLFSFFLPIADRAKPAASRLLASLTDDQVEALANNMDESQQKLEEEFLKEDPKQTRQARAERTQERVERWLGDLNEQQVTIVEKWSENRGRQTEIWLEGRRNWQKALLETLDQREEAAFKDQVAYLIDNNAEVRGPRYQQMMNESRVAMAELMTSLLERADPEQLDFLLDRASTLRGDFNTLACNDESIEEGRTEQVGQL
ncbi:DUF6279 family lipoprotein [Marinobacter sp. CHS3-4]|uniref:DUF6279 family lipoprotein n=1 Tax=Marinobacter sp. CHS3-4 TaxID=3045174 RepID=UPI0024B60BD3|nr:DUF6279 family lipoprotein [Marinobacter sp. CHS3-4]MDI9246076.1 DUF6279 family lipoprotein [Marinobacter sp. CHS3-4]